LIKLNQSLNGQSVTKLKLTNIISTGANTYTAIPVIELTKTASIGLNAIKNKSFAPIYITTSAGPTPTAGTIIGCSTNGGGAGGGAAAAATSVTPPLVTEGNACTPEGSIGHDSTGALLSCQGGVWGPSKNYKGFVSISFYFYKNINGAGLNALCQMNGMPSQTNFWVHNLSDPSSTNIRCEIGNGRVDISSFGPMVSDSSATIATVPYLFDCVPGSSVYMSYSMSECTGISSSSVQDHSGRAYLTLSGPSCNTGTMMWQGITDPKFSVGISATCKYK
jgi:hypothetical protein